MAHKVEEGIKDIIEKLEALDRRLTTVEERLEPLEVNLKTFITEETATVVADVVHNSVTEVLMTGGLYLGGAGVVAAVLGVLLRRRRRASKRKP